MLSIQHSTRISRRPYLRRAPPASSSAGPTAVVREDGPPETTKIRIAKGPPLCWAPDVRR